MRAETPGWGRLRPPTFTAARLTVGVLVALLVLPAILLAGLGWWQYAAYLVLMLATAAVLRSVSGQPGTWLGRRAVRRALVAALVADCAGLLLATALQPAPWSAVLLLVLLVLLDVALGRATQRLAAAPDQAVDERQEALRNRAHRLAYWMLAVFVGGTLVADVAAPQSRAWLENSVPLGLGLLVFLQLLLVLPAMTLAWLEPDRLAPEDVTPAQDRRAPLALGMLALTIAAPFLLSLGPALIPVRTTSSTSPPRTSAGLATGPSQCREFMASAQAGIGVGATIPLHAVACWNGRNAYEAWGLNASDCHLDSSFLATVSTEQCARTTGPGGALRFTYRALVRPTLLPFMGREVTVALVLDRDGRVERFP